MNTILIAVLLAICYSFSNEAPLLFNWDPDRPSRNVSGSERGINTLNDSVMLNLSATNKDGVDHSFQKSVEDDSSNNTHFNSINSNLYVRNNINQNRSPEFEVEINDAKIEQKQMNNIVQNIIFSLIRLANDQINLHKHAHSLNEIKKNVTSDVEGPTVIQLETLVQSQKTDDVDLPAKPTNTLPNDDATRIENSQNLNNSTQDTMPEVSDLAKRNKTRLEKSLFSNVSSLESPPEANDNRQKMMSADGGHVKRIRKMFEKIVGENYIHENKDVKTMKRASVLSALKRLYKRSTFKRSKNDKKTRRMIVAENNEKDNTMKNKNMAASKKLIRQIRNVKESKGENVKLSDLLDIKDTFEKETGFVAFKKKKKDTDSVYMSKLKNSANLNNGNLYRSLVKKDSDIDLPSNKPEDILYNVDRSELQAFGADIEPIKQDECQFVKYNMKDQQGKVPAQLNAIHINHHIISRTNCPLNEDDIDYPEDSKVYKISSFDSLPINEPDFRNLYDQPKNTHTSEELNDVFKQVELEVLGLDDDSVYQDDLLKNYSISQVDDIFKKLYFEIFDIKENKNFDEPHWEDATDKDHDSIFKNLNFTMDDDSNEYEDLIKSGSSSISDIIKGCKDMETIACKKMLSKDTEKANNRNTFNSVDFSVDKNGVVHGIEGIMGFNKPQENKDIKKNAMYFYITQECFENITQNKGLGLTDIQRAQMNCTDSNLNNNDDDINLKGRGNTSESIISQTTVKEDNIGKTEWNETESDSDSANEESSDGEDLNLKNKHHPKNDSDSDSANEESNDDEDLNLKNKHHPKNDSDSDSANEESSDDEDLNVKNKHHPKNDSVSDSANEESNDDEDLNLKNKHHPKNDSVSDSANEESSDDEDLNLKHKHHPKNDSVSNSANEESSDDEDLNLKHKHHPKNDSVSDSENEESSDDEDLNLKNKHHPKNDSDSDSENEKSSDDEDLNLKHKHHPNNDRVSDSANEVSSDDEDLNLKNKHHHGSVNEESSDDGHHLPFKHTHHHKDASANVEHTDGHHLPFKHTHNHKDASANVEHTDGHHLSFKHTHNHKDASANVEHTDGHHLPFKHTHHHKNDSANVEYTNDHHLPFKQTHHHKNGPANVEYTDGHHLNFKHTHHHKNDSDSDDILNKNMAINKATTSDEKHHLAKISISVKANIKHGSILDNLKLAESHNKDKMTVHNFQHGVNSNKNKDQNQHQVSLETNCEITIGKRSSAGNLCLRNNTQENNNLSFNNIQQNGVDESEIVLVGETNDRNVSESLNPETIILQIDNTTSKEEGINFTQVIT